MLLNKTLHLFIFFLSVSLTSFSQGSGYSLAFTESNNQYVSAPQISSTFGTGTNDLTVECFVLLSNSGTSGAVTSYTTENGGWAIHVSSGAVDFIVGTSSGKFTRVTSPKLTTNQWYHVVGVKRGTSIELYVNGVFIGQKPLEYPFSTTTTLAIGRRYINLNNYLLDGQVDEVRIWNHALAENEIRTWMCKKLTSAHPNYSSLVRYYNFNTGSGSTLVDHAGNNDGTLFNSPTWEVSGAPIGDQSTFQYTANPNISLSHGTGESLTVNSFSSSIQGAHIYRVDANPNTSVGMMPLPNSNKYFGVFKAGDNTNTATYNVVYNYTGNPDVNINNESDLELYSRLNNANSPWIGATALLNIPSKTLTYSSSNNTEVIIGEIDVPLPIELLFFTISNDEKSNAQVEWATASETNNDYFTIERSADGEKWRELNDVKGAGNSTSTLNYSYSDKDRLFGTSYYRLKQTDYDGKHTYSQTKSINIEESENSNLAIYPNPFNNQFYVKGNSSTLDQIRIYNATGKDVTALTTRSDFNGSTVKFDLSQLSVGLYFVITETTSSKIQKYK